MRYDTADDVAHWRALSWQSTRIWCLHAGAAILYLHAGLARMVASFPSSCISAADADALSEMASWPSSTTLPELIALLLQADDCEAAQWEGEKVWYGMGAPVVAGALCAASLERLVYLDAQLAVPIALTAPTPHMSAGQPELVSEAASLAQSLLRQFNASLWQLCQDSGANGGAAEVAAAGVCRLVLARLPLVVTFCNDSGTSARSIWKTLLSAAAAFLRRRRAGEEKTSGKDATQLIQSPYAGPIWELLSGGGGGGEGLYDIPVMHSELGAALIETLVLDVEALLSCRGRDLLEGCNGSGVEPGAAWGCRALVALRRAVKKRDKLGKDKKLQKEKKGEKDKKRKEREGADKGAGCEEEGGVVEAREAGSVADAEAARAEEMLKTCENMWSAHPGEGGGGAGADEKEGREKRSGSDRRASEAVRRLQALLLCVGAIPPDMLSRPCRQALLLAFAAIEPIVASAAALDEHNALKDVSRALLSSHLADAAASGGREGPSSAQSTGTPLGSDAGVQPAASECTLKVITWLLLDQVEDCSGRALSDSCTLLQTLAMRCSKRGLEAAGTSTLHALIVSAIREYVEGGEVACASGSGKDKRSKKEKSTKKRSKEEGGGGGGGGDGEGGDKGWGRCVRACALVGGVVSAAIQQEISARQQPRRAGREDAERGRQDEEARDVDEDTVSLLREVETLVVKAWVQVSLSERASKREEFRLSMLVALSAHVLRFGAALRSLAKGRGSHPLAAGAGAHELEGGRVGGHVAKLVGGMLAFSFKAVLPTSSRMGGPRGHKAGRGNQGVYAGLLEECCSHFVESVCACLGRLKPALSGEGYSQVLALLLTPGLRLVHSRRIQCMRELLLNSSREQVCVRVSVSLSVCSV